MNCLKTVLLCASAAAIFGVAHDQVTVRICTEYFTIAHPPLFPTRSPTIVALCWGVASTVWLGGAFGLVLHPVVNSSGAPPVVLSRLLRLLATLLSATAASALLTGLLAFHLSRSGVLPVPVALDSLLPASRHNNFMAVWFAHMTSYFIAIAGGALIVHRLWRERGRPVVPPLLPQTRSGVLRVALLAISAATVLYFRLRGR